MAEADLLQRQLIREQNADGGWGYAHLSSWTEPTALALLALEAYGIKGSQYERGCAWLGRSQRPDGGWAPNPAVQTSTWVTSLAALALSDLDPYRAKRDTAQEWLIRQMRPETSSLERLIRRLRESDPQFQPGGGSPWFPGTAPWVIPTALSIFTFSQAKSSNQQKFKDRIHAAQQYLLSRRCKDGGWNHGGSRYRSEDATSYPETTGLALLALSGVPASELTAALLLAERFWQSLGSTGGSVEGETWLQLALTKHGRTVPPIASSPCRTTRDVCLRLLALAPANTNKLMLL